MTNFYRILNNEKVYLSNDELEEISLRKDWELKINLPIQARRQRDILLAATDWTQAADVPQAIKDKWAPYRQALRDVPQQAGFPENVVWPDAPTT
jgi:hypothetical protein